MFLLKGLIALSCAISMGFSSSHTESEVKEPESIVEVIEEEKETSVILEVIEEEKDEIKETVKEAATYVISNGTYMLVEIFTESIIKEAYKDKNTTHSITLLSVRYCITLINKLFTKYGYPEHKEDYEALIASIDEVIDSIISFNYGSEVELYNFIMGLISIIR